MAIYQVGCPHCKVTTIHEAATPEEAETKHRSAGLHAEMHKILNPEKKQRPDEFNRGKDNNA